MIIFELNHSLLLLQMCTTAEWMEEEKTKVEIERELNYFANTIKEQR